MEARRSDDPVAFLEAALPLLLEEEAKHSLLLGLAGTLRDHPAVYPDFDLWLVEDGEEVVGAALRTLPMNLVLARPRSDRALAVLAAAVTGSLPGVVGAVPEVTTFAAAWSTRTGAEPRVLVDQGIYQLEQVVPVQGVEGRTRAVGAADLELVVDWWRAFLVEALHDDAPADADVRHAVETRLGEGSGLVVWDDDGPVSFAGFTGATPNGIRIGPVYTPPGRRGRGYASALVAELSAALLADGRRFCFLYTDLANPTSNKIYERIGYRRVCDSAAIAFQQPG